MALTKYVSAKWQPPSLPGMQPMIKAIGDDDLEYFVTSIDSDVTPWPAFLADGGVIEDADPIAEPVPETLSRRQFFQQAAIDGLITQDEALAAVTTGTIPPPMQEYVDSLPVEEQFNAKMLFGGAQAFERNAEITSDFGNAKGMTAEEIDQFFIDGAQLTA